MKPFFLLLLLFFFTNAHSNYKDKQDQFPTVTDDCNNSTQGSLLTQEIKHRKLLAKLKNKNAENEGKQGQGGTGNR